MRTYLESRGRSPQSPLPHDVDDRLRQIQATVETTAIEVERVAEANRYLTRVLAERGITPVLDAPSNRAPAKQ
jgi:hypothetical protein